LRALSPAPSLRPSTSHKDRSGQKARHSASPDRGRRFLKAVLTGELRECSWEALKAVYFTGSTEQACVNIGIFAEQRRIGPVVANRER
jgi:hypothetical protein